MPRTGRIYARPKKIARTGPTGLQPLPVGGQRDSYLYVPPAHSAENPSALVLLLHGSGGHAHHGLDILQDLADAANLILVAPASAGYTWDVIIGRWGRDVKLINQALEHVFASYAIDPSRVAIGGFSDGASYALSLGLTNGDLFTHVIAFSPGTVAPVVRRGAPKIFISHGIRDEILPVSTCGRRIVEELRESGLDVEYREFDAGHRIPPDIALAAVSWFTGRALRREAGPQTSSTSMRA